MLEIRAKTRDSARRKAPVGSVLTQLRPGRWAAFALWSEYIAWRRENAPARPAAPERGPVVKLQVWVSPGVRAAVKRLRRPGESGGDMVARAVAALQAEGQ